MQYVVFTCQSGWAGLITEVFKLGCLLSWETAMTSINTNGTPMVSGC